MVVFLSIRHLDFKIIRVFWTLKEGNEPRQNDFPLMIADKLFNPVYDGIVSLGVQAVKLQEPHCFYCLHIFASLIAFVQQNL